MTPTSASRPSAGGILLLAALFIAPISGCDRNSPRPAPGAKGNVIEVTSATFSREVERSSLPVAVDFWAPWCGPCRSVAPTLEKLAGEYRGRLKICKVNVDENKDLAQRFQVRAIPTIIVFQGGRSAGSKTGALSERKYRSWFSQFAR